jgi:hypothetical protein
MPAKDFAKRALRKTFEGGQRIGVDVLPRHFYSSIPDIKELRQSSTWRRPRTLHSVAGSSIDDQAQAFTDCFSDEIVATLRKSDVYAAACSANGAVGYGPIEAETLYAYVARHKPPRVVQVGAGVATALILSAARDAGYSIDVTCVDPFPTPYLVEMEQRGEIKLRAVPAQEMPLDELADVGPGGLLFVDSTHTVKPGSEVNRIILDALPVLPAGSVAHFHDITFPYDYPPDLLDGELFFWNETALLLAYLTDNQRARIDFSMSMLHHARPSSISNILSNYRPAANEDGIQVQGGHYPSSIFLSFA